MNWVLVVGVVLVCGSHYVATEGEEGEYFEGDMILTPDQLSALEEQRTKQNSFAAIKSDHWKTNGKADVVKFYIDRKDFDGLDYVQETIRRALKEYHRFTCLRFEEVGALPSPPYIHFVKKDGCFSQVGRLSWGNQVSLGYGCWNTGTILHEVAHALGFFHEQSRPDRDQYVEIMWNNIKSGEKHNFDKYTTKIIDSLDTEYDYESIMHYKNNAFGIDRRQYTIRTIDPSKRKLIGQRNTFSRIDKIQINRMYCGTAGTDGYTRPTMLTKAPTTEMGCVDNYVKNCPGMWASQCDRWFVQNNCKKTCGLCKGGKVTTKAPTTQAPTTKAPATKAPSNCQDKNASCYAWKQYCSSNEYVKTNCLKTCGRC